MKSSLVLGLLLLATTNIHARDIKGKVTDAQTGEEINRSFHSYQGRTR